MINGVMQAHSASGIRSTVSVTCVVSCQNERENRYVFTAAENDVTLGAVVTKSQVRRSMLVWPRLGKERDD